MEFKDYYKIMGVAPEATSAQIKQAYRKLARKYHPDVSKEAKAEEHFKEVGEAYEVLKDHEKRAAYDQLRQSGWKQGEEFKTPPNWQYDHQSHTTSHQDFSDFFQSIFGEAGFQPRGHHVMRGENISAAITVSLEEAYDGCHKTFQIPTQKLTPEGYITTENRTIKVTIPKGISEGQHIRLKEQGEPGLNGGPNGDLYLQVHIKPHPVFVLKDKDIHLILPIAPWEAALGAKVKVPTLGGTVEMKIPQNSQSGNKLRLPKRGLPGSPPGDQYVQLQIVNPSNIAEHAKKLYEELSSAASFDPRKELGV